MVKKDLNPVFIHALYLVNLGTDNPDLLEKSFNSLLFDLKNGDLINCTGVVVHLGSHQGRGFESIKSQVIDHIKKLIDATKTTPFLIENSSGQKGKIGTLDEITQIFAEIKSDRLRICLDTAHLFESGTDIAELDKFTLLNKVTCLHLNDSKTAFDSRNDQHANLGVGEIGLEKLKQFVNHPQLNHLPNPKSGQLGLPDAKNISIAKSLLTTHILLRQ
jgi:deoxyribonuclease-4